MWLTWVNRSEGKNPARQADFAVGGRRGRRPAQHAVDYLPAQTAHAVACAWARHGGKRKSGVNYFHLDGGFHDLPLSIWLSDMHAWESSAPWFRQLFCVRHICEALADSREDAVVRQAPADPVVDASAGISELLIRLRDRDFVVVRLANKSLVQLERRDLECLPVRLWLFGHVSCFERCLLELVRRDYPRQDFARVLTEERFAAAQRLYRARVGRHEALDLADCLQIADKRELLLAERGAAKRLGFASRKQAKRFLEHVETLRDRLAHAHDLVPDKQWPGVIEVALRLVEFLHDCYPEPTERSGR